MVTITSARCNLFDAKLWLYIYLHLGTPILVSSEAVSWRFSASEKLEVAWASRSTLCFPPPMLFFTSAWWEFFIIYLSCHTCLLLPLWRFDPRTMCFLCRTYQVLIQHLAAHSRILKERLQCCLPFTLEAGRRGREWRHSRVDKSESHLSIPRTCFIK